MSATGTGTPTALLSFVERLRFAAASDLHGLAHWKRVVEAIR